MSQELVTEFREAIEQDSNASSVDEITTRQCGTDNFDGVQYDFVGECVPVRPIIEIVAEKEGIAIEQLYHLHDGDHIRLVAFVADLPEQPHPAFVNGRY